MEQTHPDLQVKEESGVSRRKISFFSQDCPRFFSYFYFVFVKINCEVKKKIGITGHLTFV